jgi:hypothetical protein
MITSYISIGTNSVLMKSKRSLQAIIKVRRTRQKLYIALGETLDGRLAFVVFGVCQAV